MRWLFFVSALAGCHCGTYQISGSGLSFGEQPVDGAYAEACGATHGTTGAWDAYDNGNVEFTLSPDGGPHQEDGFGQFTLSFPTRVLVVGDTIDMPPLTGSALLADATGAEYAHADLASGHVKILSGDLDPGDDACALPDGPTFRLSWSVIYTGGLGQKYTADGADKVQFATAGSAGCADTGT